MGIKLNIEVETPLSDDDRDILAGISVMVLAIANRQNLLDQPHMQEQKEEDILEDAVPPVCGHANSTSEPTTYCHKEPDHSGRHKHRPLREKYN